MKKIISIVSAVVLIAAMIAVSVSAGAFNAAGNCSTTAIVKKADSSVVIKDGKIGDGEYTEIEINRDPDTSDLMISWDGPSENFDNAQAFIQNVHFYMSWDEVHGLNVAARTQLLETPVNPCTNGGDPGFQEDIPGDQFLFQFGMMFRTAWENSSDTVYRGISINTETGELLYGWYRDQDGYTGSLNQTAGTDYTVSVDGNWVTYEISFPLSTILPAGSISGSSPTDGSQFPFDVSVTGGSQGEYHEGCSTYAVSIGDGGYLTSKNFFDTFEHGIATFTMDPVAAGTNTGDNGGDNGGETGNNNGGSQGSQGTTNNGGSTTAPSDNGSSTTETQVLDDGTTITTVTNEDGTKTVTTTTADGTTTTKTEKAPQTGDPMIIAAAVSAISACGIMVARRRRG